MAAGDDPLIGSEVGRYRVTRLLGRGGMGRVYLATQPAIGSRVAIKILSRGVTPQRPEHASARFFDEARAVNLIHHEHIVDILDFGYLSDGRPFIVMEYVDGRTLRELVDAGARSRSAPRCASRATCSTRSRRRTRRASSIAISSRTTSW